MRVLPALLFLAAARAAAGTPVPALYDRVEVPPLKASIVIGSVTLTATPFVRHGQGYDARYAAHVFPYSFFDEAGTLRIDFPDADLRRLASGQPVAFTGRAVRDDGAVRRVDGRVTPEGPDRGRIKVRVSVGRGLSLTFSAAYRLGGS
jgi:hypothetical protein